MIKYIDTSSFLGCNAHRFSIAILVLLLSSASCVVNAQRSGKVAVSTGYTVAPIFKKVAHNPAIRIRVSVPGGEVRTYKALNINLSREAVAAIQILNVYESAPYEDAFNPSSRLLASAKPSEKTSIPFKLTCKPGLTYVWISVILKDDADPDLKIRLGVKGLVTESGNVETAAIARGEVDRDGSFSFRIGVALRKPGDDGVHTYRIPGMVTTDKGTLIAVYDIRYTTSRDLPGNVDVGMNRSTDGGKRWGPMKNILDMGPSHENNGVGHPSILFDPSTKTIWVAALWSKGDRSIAGSQPGLSPDSTGQFVLTSSKDDGLTWSDPVNITAQVKDPKWHIYFQGPGSGIAMADGTLVFPSQFWDESKKPGIPHASIIYSKDGGKSWKSGVGAKPNTTESQVVETGEGILMLNMRDNRGNFRSISTSHDLGKTWTEHHTSRQALPDPVCMASIIKARVTVKERSKDMLFFSNVSSETARHNTTIKASADLGESWDPQSTLLIDERRTYGYSSLTRIDANTIGILYEGFGELYFVRIPVNEIIR